MSSERALEPMVQHCGHCSCWCHGGWCQRTRKVARKATHGIKFSYSVQKDAYADLEFMNDVGHLDVK